LSGISSIMIEYPATVGIVNPRKMCEYALRPNRIEKYKMDRASATSDVMNSALPMILSIFVINAISIENVDARRSISKELALIAFFASFSIFQVLCVEY